MLAPKARAAKSGDEGLRLKMRSCCHETGAAKKKKHHDAAAAWCFS
jgi:hypothetical protein